MSEIKIIDGKEYKVVPIKSIKINGVEKKTIDAEDVSKSGKIEINIEADNS